MGVRLEGLGEARKYAQFCEACNGLNGGVRAEAPPYFGRKAFIAASLVSRRGPPTRSMQ